MRKRIRDLSIYRITERKKVRMTNREKYLDKIIAIAMQGDRLAVKDGEPTTCNKIEACSICELNDIRHTCDYARGKWLEEDIKRFEWIAVSKRLPEDGELVIVTAEDVSSPIIARYKSGKFKIEVGEVGLDFADFRVTAWTPAPMVYRGK